MSIKQQRSAGRIREIMSEVLLTEVSDPRLAGVTVTEVKIDRELRHANIYVAAIGADEGEAEDVLDGLKSAKGFLRSALAQRLQSRVTPFLYFHWDARLEDASRIEDILFDMEIPTEDANPVDPDLEI